MDKWLVWAEGEGGEPLEFSASTVDVLPGGVLVLGKDVTGTDGKITFCADAIFAPGVWLRACREVLGQ